MLQVRQGGHASNTADSGAPLGWQGVVAQGGRLAWAVGFSVGFGGFLYRSAQPFFS